MIRKPAVSGMFYYNDKEMLRNNIASFWPKDKTVIPEVKGVMVPHAGYMYSGPLAAKVYASLDRYDSYILLGPNHTGNGEKIAVSAMQSWQTPLGMVDTNSALTKQIVDQIKGTTFDDAAHKQEHSLEVQLPLLQYQGNAFDMVAICIRTWDIEELQTLGKGLAQVIRESNRKIVIIASSDMNHFANLENTEKLDQLALDPVLDLDPKGLINRVVENDISMCGAAPTVVMLEAVNQLGARQAELIGHTTSAEMSGDHSSVVGYAGIVIK